MKCLNKIKCAVGQHEYVVTREISILVRELKCKNCDKEFAMYGSKKIPNYETRKYEQIILIDGEKFALFRGIRYIIPLEEEIKEANDNELRKQIKQQN